jgi:hypothetical protein
LVHFIPLVLPSSLAPFDVGVHMLTFRPYFLFWIDLKQLKKSGQSGGVDMTGLDEKVAELEQQGFGVKREGAAGSNASTPAAPYRPPGVDYVKPRPGE